MTTLMPADRHSRTASGRSAERIGKADKAQELEREFVRRIRPCSARQGGAGDAQHAQALGGHRVDGLRQRRAIGGI